MGYSYIDDTSGISTYTEEPTRSHMHIDIHIYTHSYPNKKIFKHGCSYIDDTGGGLHVETARANNAELQVLPGSCLFCVFDFSRMCFD